MWQAKRSPLNAPAQALTLPVNTEGRQGGHSCCGGRGRPAETVFIITPRNTENKTKKNKTPRQKRGAVRPPAAVCGREITMNNEKNPSVREHGTFSLFAWQALPSPVDRCELYKLAVIWIAVISQRCFSRSEEVVQGRTAAQTCLQSWSDSQFSNYLMCSFRSYKSTLWAFNQSEERLASRNTAQPDAQSSMHF